MPKIIKITQADIDKLPQDIRDNPAAMGLVNVILTTYTALEAMLGYDLVLAVDTPTPDAPPVVTPPVEAGAPVPIKLAHGDSCGVPSGDKAKEHIWRIDPYSDVRFLEFKDDTFIGDFARDHFRVENDYCVADDFEHSGVIYAFDHFSVATSKDKTTTNPLKVGNKSTFRVWWNCYGKK